MLVKAGVNVKKTDDRGQTALHMAAKRACPDSINALVEVGYS